MVVCIVKLQMYAKNTNAKTFFFNRRQLSWFGTVMCGKLLSLLQLMYVR